MVEPQGEKFTFSQRVDTLHHRAVGTPEVWGDSPPPWFWRSSSPYLNWGNNLPYHSIRNGGLDHFLLVNVFYNALQSFCGLSLLQNPLFYFHMLHMYMYISTSSIPASQFPSHLLPPSSLNVYFSVLKTGKLLLIPNSAPSRVGLLKVHLYQILCNEAT